MANLRTITPVLKTGFIFLPLLGLVAVAQAAQEKLPASYLKVQQNVQCAYLLGKSKKRSWIPAVKVGTKYLGAAAALKEKNVSAKIKAAAKKIAKSRVCESLINVSAFNVLPTADDVLVTASEGLTSASVTGTPPLLTTIFQRNESDLSTTFWESDIISAIRSGAPSTDQCTEYTGTAGDGNSAGVGACKLAQDLGDSFTALLRGKTGPCFFQNVFSNDQVATGGLTVTRGTVPAAGVASLLAVPTGTANRTLRLSNGGTTHFLRIYSDFSNRSSGVIYQYDTWACASLSPGSGPSVLGIRSGVVSPDGLIRIDDKFSNAFVQSQLSVSGALRMVSSGQAQFDGAVARAISGLQIVSVPYTVAFKSLVTIAPSGLVSVQVFDRVASTLRKTYGLGRFSGTEFSELRFLEGASKFRLQTTAATKNAQSAFEFRDTGYYASASNPLTAGLDLVSFDSDSFYTTEPTLSLDLSQFSCDATSDYDVTIDPTRPSIQSVISSCVETGFVGNMCRAFAFSDAEEKYLSSCS